MSSSANNSSLPSTYYRYLTHIPPYDRDDRLSVLTASVIGIQSKDAEHTLSPNENRIQRAFATRPSHDQTDFDTLLQFYTDRRLRDAVVYYRYRVDEAEINTRFVSRVSFLLLMAAVVLAATSLWATQTPQVGMLVLVAILPTIALMLTGFRWLYGWERQADLYRDSAAALRRAAAMVEDLGSLPQSEKKAVLMRIVTTTEDAIHAELNQWGISQGCLGSYQREGYLEVEPMFGLPPNETTFQCDVFMIMPFAEAFASVYADHIKPLVQHELQLDIKRGDDCFSEHAIMREVWGAIFNSRLVLVECTGHNANVYYELGIAHTLGKPAVMITQNIDDIPFDLRHLRHIVYDDSEAGLSKLNNDLRNAIRALQ